MSVGRRGNQKQWHLREAWLPEWADQELPAEAAVVRLACQRSLKALGVANQKQINNHFMRGMYPELGERLTELAAAEVVLPAQIVGEDGRWAGEWYMHRESLPLLESIGLGDGRRARSFCRHSTISSVTGNGQSSFSVSTTELRFTCQKPSGSTAIM